MSWRGEAIELTAREFNLLVTLALHADQVLDRPSLLEQVWELRFDPGTNVVDVYVRYLRARMGQEIVRTVRGVGYMMVTEDLGSR